MTSATVPPKFTQDFLATTLDMPGGGARPVIKFLKRSGFLTSDGSPTDLYKQFRNSSLRGAAAAQGMRKAYADLYAANEYVHNASDKDLKGLIIQVTGLEPDSKLITAMVGSFKALKQFRLVTTTRRLSTRSALKQSLWLHTMRFSIRWSERSGL